MLSEKPCFFLKGSSVADQGRVAASFAMICPVGDLSHSRSWLAAKRLIDSRCSSKYPGNS